MQHNGHALIVHEDYKLAVEICGYMTSLDFEPILAISLGEALLRVTQYNFQAIVCTHTFTQPKSKGVEFLRNAVKLLAVIPSCVILSRLFNDVDLNIAPGYSAKLIVGIADKSALKLALPNGDYSHGARAMAANV